MNNQYMIESLTRQKERIDDMIRAYQQPTPVNNIINTTQQPLKDMLEYRILNENEEVDNLYVTNKTLFLGDKNMVIKGVDGSLEKWEIKKTYPVDKKDEKISMLEEEIKKLKEVLDEHSKPTSPDDKFNQSNGITNVNVESRAKTNGKSIPKQI